MDQLTEAENKREPKVAILMASFNGSRHIEEQLKSIRGQTYRNWHLFVSDNGSTDSTRDILSAYGTRESRMEKLLMNNEKRGAFLNFYFLLQYAKEHLADSYEYFFLCDQDDLWDERKISIQVEKMKETDGRVPALSYTDLQIMNEDGSPASKKMSDIYLLPLKNAADIFFNPVHVWGNTVCFNACLLRNIRIPDDVYKGFSHDQFLAYYAAGFGQCLYLDLPLTFYRRYQGNVSEIRPNASLHAIAGKLVGGIQESIDRHAETYSNVLEFLDANGREGSLLEDIYEAYIYGGRKAMGIIRKYHVMPGPDRAGALTNRFILLTGIYKKSDKYRYRKPAGKD